MTTEKRKRGRPRKNVTTEVENAPVLATEQRGEPTIEPELPKFYWGYVYFVSAQHNYGGERLVGQVTYTESTDILDFTVDENLPSYREFRDQIHTGLYDVVDVQYGNKYLIKGIDSEYETQ